MFRAHEPCLVDDAADEVMQGMFHKETLVCFRSGVARVELYRTFSGIGAAMLSHQPESKPLFAPAGIFNATQPKSSQCCPTYLDLDPENPVSERQVVPRSPLGFRTSSLLSDAELIHQWGKSRVALLDRDLAELKENCCVYCKLLLHACQVLGISGIEINIWLEQGQNPKVTVWREDNSHISFELFADTGKLRPTLDSWQNFYSELVEVTVHCLMQIQWKMFLRVDSARFDMISQYPDASKATTFLTECIEECNSEHIKVSLAALFHAPKTN